MRAGGCDFVAEPDLDWRHTPVFWRAEVADDVACFHHSSQSPRSAITGQDLISSATFSREADDGLHLNWPSGDQALLLAPVSLNLPASATLPLNGSQTRRFQSAQRIWRHMHDQPAGKAQAPSSHRRRYLTRALRALRGHLSGASHREVAIELVGADVVPSGTAWKTSEMRSMILRLTQLGRRLSEGGYLSLLGQGSDFNTP